MKTAKKRIPKSARLISLLLAIVLTATMVPALAFANSTEVPAGTAAEQGVEGAETAGDEGRESETVGVEGETPEETDSSSLSSILGSEQGEALLQDNSGGALGGGAATRSSAADCFTNIDVVLNPSTFQTYDNPVNLSGPTPLIVTLQVQPTASYSEGGRIELALDYNPTAQNLSSFTYGTDGTNGVGNAAGKPTPDFFVLNTAALDEAIKDSASIVKSYKVEDGVLKLELKSAAEYPGSMAGLKALQLDFSFNADYKMKVPNGSTLWQPRAKVYVGNDLSQQSEVKKLTTNTSTTITQSIIKRNPANETYLGGLMNTRFLFSYSNPYEVDFDSSYNNRIWVDLPAGTTVSGSTGADFLAFFSDGKETIDGYDRYYKKISNTKGAWSSYDPSWASAYTSTSPDFTPPETVKDGDTFFVRMGVDYRKINSSAITETNEASYIKQQRAVWDLSANRYHGPHDSRGVICGIENGDVVNTSLYAPYGEWADERALKNLGSGPITGTVYELYQTSSSSAKLNYNKVTFKATRGVDDAGDLAAWSSYYYEFEIVNALNGSTRTVEGGTLKPTDANATSESLYPELPDLSASEYINVLRVIPMGTSGNAKGEMASLNGFAVYYSAKAWPDKTWPDGSAVQNTNSRASMAWRLTYNDNPNKPGAYPENGEGVAPVIHQGNTATVHYSSQPFAQSRLSSNTASVGVKPGSVVDYTLFGYNNAYQTVGAWNNPQVLIRVPDTMELVDLSETKVLTDTLSGKTYEAKVVQTGSGNGSHYYAVSAQGYSAPLRTGQNAVFSVPLQFKVSDAAQPGDYAAPRTVTTTTTPSTYWGSNGQTINASLGEDKELYGLQEGDNYAISGLASSALQVVSWPRLDVSSAVSSEATNGQGVTSALVPAKHGEITKMMLTIANNGNVNFSGIRLYNILPYAGDKLDSEGQISFVGLNVDDTSGLTIRYTTDVAGTVTPTYGEHDASNATLDLQTATFQDSWTEGNPTEDATAYFLDFGERVLAAGESITIELLFKIPEDGDQTAINQFAYSAKQVVGSAAALNQNAPAQGFSTKTIGIIYHEGLPAVYDTGGVYEGEEDLSGMPMANTASFVPELPATTQDLKVDSSELTLTGYAFKGWATSAGASVVDYAPGATITFSDSGTVNLYPVWEINTAAVSYSYDDSAPSGAPAVPATNAKPFADRVNVATNPAVKGYTFSGWTTTDVQVEDGQFLMPNKPVDFSGSWSANSDTAYTVEHYLVGADGTPALKSKENFTGTTDETATASEKAFTGYTFNPNHASSKPSGSIAGDGSLALKLYYEINRYTVTFVDYNGTVLAARTQVPYGGDALAPANPARVGYTFTGWDRGFGNITSDVTVTALYTAHPVDPITPVDPVNPTDPTETFTVTFISYNNNVIQSSTVEEGGSVTPPANPTRTGYRFNGWDKDSSAWTNVTANVTVTAKWDDQVVATPPLTTGPGTTTSGGNDGGTPAEALALAAEEQGIPTIGVPLAAPAGFEAWALANLVLAALGAVMALVFSFMRNLRKDDKINEAERNEQRQQRAAYAAQTGSAASAEEPLRKRRSLGWLFAAIALAVVGLVFFVATQDILLPMVWFDAWTIVQVLLLVAILILGNIAIGRKKIAPEEDEDDTAPEAV